MRPFSHEDVAKLAVELLSGTDEADLRVPLIEKAESFMAEAAKPLVDDDDRVEVVMLMIHNDREEALKAIAGIFKTSYPFKLTVYENSINTRNTAKIWNKLIKESTCKYILLLDSDCYAQNDIITPMIRALKDSHKCIAVGPAGGNSVFPKYQQVNFSQTQPPIQLQGHISGCCFMFDKLNIQEMGGFDEDFVFYGQDSDFFERVVEKGWFTYIVPNALAYHGEIDAEEASISANKLRNENKFDPQLDSAYARVLYLLKKRLRGGLPLHTM